MKEATEYRDVLLVSDRNVGLMEAIPDVFGSCKHFFCLVHLYRNLKELFGGKRYSSQFQSKMCSLLKDCAYAPSIRLFDEKIDIFIREGGQVASDFLSNIPYEKWSIAHCREKRYGEMTSNAAESFNNWILDARGLPITHMVDCIRSKIMKWFTERLCNAKKWNKILCWKMDKKWCQYLAIGSTWHVCMVNNVIFEVLSDPSITVNLENRTCSCYQWQIKGFPCCHAAAVLKRHSKNIDDVVDNYFLTSYYVKCHVGTLMPIPTTERYDLRNISEAETILPPITNRLISRTSEEEEDRIKRRINKQKENEMQQM